MFTADDFSQMQHALRLGERAQASSPNPRVGCVLVQDGRIIGEGYTQHAGGHHAEIQALEQARAAGLPTQGATAFVTLEPCAHFGRTPPCARALIQARVARVVVATEDPNPLVAGKGLQMLRDAGIDVRCGLLAREARQANIGFFSRILRRRPWVRLKMASSLDGRSALQNGVSQWITGPDARLDGHRWRARACAVLTGIGTILGDDPLLTARHVGAVRQPQRIVLDSQRRLPATARLLDGPPIWLFHAAQGPDPDWFRTSSIQSLALANDNGRVDLVRLLGVLAERGVNELHVEAGAQVSGAFLELGLVDEILLYQAGVFLGPGQDVALLPGRNNLDNLVRWQLAGFQPVGADWRFLLQRADQAFDGQ
jgi:diaminohydroxyphosphoribosylaminopyrimidine deaminase/5-amino-6-(5-phosphoribosylamino)uracil reductase